MIKTINVVIPCRCFAKNGKDLYQLLQRTYIAIVLFSKTFA